MEHRRGFVEDFTNGVLEIVEVVEEVKVFAGGYAARGGGELG